MGKLQERAEPWKPWLSVVDNHDFHHCEGSTSGDSSGCAVAGRCLERYAGPSKSVKGSNEDNSFPRSLNSSIHERKSTQACWVPEPPLS